MVRTMTTEEKDFMARWSRRKQAAREGLAEPEPDAPELPAQTGDEPSAASEPAETANAEAFADVDFDALDYSSDYTRFMGKDVPELIQRRALSALWRSDPVLANIDGLNDYDEDYTDAARAVANLVTSYKPKQGYRTDEEMAAIEAEEKAEADAREQAAATQASQESRDTHEAEASVAEGVRDKADAPGEADAPDAAPQGDPAAET